MTAPVERAGGVSGEPLRYPTHRVTFLGGPWHEQARDVEAAPIIEVEMREGPPFRYYRWRMWRSDGGTIFVYRPDAPDAP